MPCILRCRSSTFAELIAYDKANPGKLNVANSGVGSIQHLLAIVIAKKYGLKWGMVPYRGGAPAIRAVVSNESNVIFNGALATQPFVVQNQLKGIAVSGDKRLPALPDLPTFKELDMPIVEVGSWQGFLTSKGTPPAVAARLNAEIKKILAMPDICQADHRSRRRSAHRHAGAVRRLDHQGDRRLGRGGEGGRDHDRRMIVAWRESLPPHAEERCRKRSCASSTRYGNAPDLRPRSFETLPSALLRMRRREMTSRSTFPILPSPRFWSRSARWRSRWRAS